jgi:hypothetical protein
MGSLWLKTLWLFIVLGIDKVKVNNLVPFATHGLAGIFFTTG